MDDTAPHLSPTKARAGRKANVVGYVLANSLAAIIVAFAIMLIFNR